MNLVVDININESSISKKIDQWSKHDGAKKADEKIAEYIDKDIRKTKGGGQVVTIQWVKEMAADLCKMITANAASLAMSVQANVASVHWSTPVRGPGGTIKVAINFSNSGMSRPSLVPEKYGGIDNIVALFEIGDSAPHPRVHVRIIDGSGNKTEKWSTDYIEGRGFIKSAVSEFNSKYGRFGVEATVNSPYA